MNSWIGVDFDGTLATYDKWVSLDHVGAPITLMVKRVQNWLEQGYEVKIFTARVYGLQGEELMKACAPIVKFCQQQFGRALDITCVKDFGMIELWDDRAVTVEANTGRRLAPSSRGLEIF